MDLFAEDVAGGAGVETPRPAGWRYGCGARGEVTSVHAPAVARRRISEIRQ
jgi:hypothetical protein